MDMVSSGCHPQRSEGPRPAIFCKNRGPSLSLGRTVVVLRANDDQEARRLPETLRLLDLQLAGDLAVLHRRGLRVGRVLAREDLVLARGEVDRAVVQAIDFRERRRIELTA